MSKQTAVEWLFNKLQDTNHITPYTTQGVDSFELLEQAKAMEEEQKKEMYLQGIANYDPTFEIKESKGGEQ